MGIGKPLRRTIALFDRQSAHLLDLPSLEKNALSALPLCLAAAAPNSPGHPLAALGSIEVTFVDDDEIARVHERFMAIPGATDVITFEHGEIVISTETAARQAAEYGHPLHRELTLYIIHGLLHLNGHEDTTPEGAAHMRLAQESILTSIAGPP